MLNFLLQGIKQRLQTAECHLDGINGFGDPSCHLVASFLGERLQHTARRAPDGMDALATGELDHTLAELAETNAAANEIGFALNQTENVALLGRRIQAEEQIRGRQMEET